MSFGQFGAALNSGYAFGSPFGGLGSFGYGFGSGVGPGFGPRGSLIYSSAYVAPGTNSFFSGYYPPFAAYGTNYQNPAIFPSPAPNHDRPMRPAVTPSSVRGGYVFQDGRPVARMTPRGRSRGAR
jgi:hypothetical protein